MKISFLGAAKSVTGSCYYIETRSSKLLVDCGMFQGHSKENEINEQPFPFNPADVDYVLLTHSHIDHSGRLPKLYVDGFKGEIIATKATTELCGIMLPDSGHIQEIENEWRNRKMQRAGKPPVPPLYTYQDAVDCTGLFRSVLYGETVKLNDEINIRFNDAGHILGSSIIEVWFLENGKETKVVFSGDLGNKNMPILRDPTIIESADYLLVESTYGNRIHKGNDNKVDRFVDIINETIEKGGNVIIPSFAVGRTQEVIYDLHKQLEKYDAKLQKLFNIPVFVDSPLAISATEIFRKNLDCFDEEARNYVENGDNPLEFPGLQFTKSSDESKALNERAGSSIIISASGMCDAGRIKHHLKHNLWRKESTILFVGYQAIGTLGRKLVDGAKSVKIFGEEISVNARIEMIEGFSGHADQIGLMDWIGSIRKKPKKIFVVHGEDESLSTLAGLINEKFGIETVIPERGSTYIVNTEKVAEPVEKPGMDIRYRRLAVIEQLETLREEFNELAELLRTDLKQEKEDTEIDEISAKIKTLEKAMAEVLR